jgi:hypothetical protein
VDSEQLRAKFGFLCGGAGHVAGLWLGTGQRV